MKIFKFLFTLSICWIFSNCNQPRQDNKEKSNEVLLEVLNIDTLAMKLILLPKGVCRQCQEGVQDKINNVSDIVLYVPAKEKVDNDSLFGRPCRYYDEPLLEKRGLTKLYSRYIEVDNRKIKKEEALVK